MVLGKSPSNRRHAQRRCCVYCGVTLLPKNIVHGKTPNDTRTWDHVIPASCGGKLQLPCCNWCNSEKGDMSLADWLQSEALRLRRSVVIQRQPDAEPMDEKMLRKLRGEDLARIRRDLEYHAR